MLARSLETAALAVLLVLAVISTTFVFLYPGSQSLKLFQIPANTSAPRLLEIIKGLPAEIVRYPTDLTRNILPKPIHSHNDYWRSAPLYSALSIGAVSVEADVWLHDGELFVGHEESAITEQRTLSSLYIEPLVSILDRMNPKSNYVPAGTINGVFDMARTVTLYLWIDIKTDGDDTWPVVVKALEPLRSKGWLSFVKDSEFTTRPVTVIGTGNAPMLQSSDRDYFVDAPVDRLDAPEFANLTSTTSPFASGSYRRIFGEIRSRSALQGQQLELLRTQIKAAHDKGIGVRYWDTPGWPKSTKQGIWKQLWDEGADLINADALEEVANDFWK